jgi:hypothetical protein
VDTRSFGGAGPPHIWYIFGLVVLPFTFQAPSGLTQL